VIPLGSRRNPEEAAVEIVVLGAGRVGAVIARDLAAEDGYSVTVIDVDPVSVDRAAQSGLRGLCVDLSDPDNVMSAVADSDLVVGAVPGFLGYRTVEAVLEAGKPMVDISFFPEDAFGLEAKAAAAGVACVVDCGIAPGLSNLVLGRLEAALEETHSFRCFVGGLPVERSWPWEYKAPFSPSDVIEEYIRPARFRREGKETVLAALSEVELMDFPELGTLEAFLTDGLRSLLRTCRTPDMQEKTVRYPGHAGLMRILRESGFFSSRQIQAASGAVRPRDVTEALLFDAWRFEDGEPDLTVMRLTLDGRHEGRSIRHVYDLVDYYDPETRTSSMARTTGYMCTAMVHLLTSGLWTAPGLVVPEMVGRCEDCYDAVLRHLHARGVQVTHRIEDLEAREARSAASELSVERRASDSELLGRPTEVSTVPAHGGLRGPRLDGLQGEAGHELVPGPLGGRGRLRP
jgi:saccharopine dehydrogenase-like NADP-dependent oxidoreductase